uniref:Uncharacterized protein n=1 Tax=Anguilla anguilla TaxID=7936 RepID=A0A0E9VIG5_ANGAN
MGTVLPVAITPRMFSTSV